MSGDPLTGPSLNGPRAAAVSSAAAALKAGASLKGPLPGGVSESAAASRRAAKAIRDFQSVFLMEMMKPLTQELSGAPSEDAAGAGFGLSSGADVYSYFWGEALAQHLAGALPGLPGSNAGARDSTVATSVGAKGGMPHRAGLSGVAESTRSPAMPGVSAGMPLPARIPGTGIDPLAAGVTSEGVSDLTAVPPRRARRPVAAALADATLVARPATVKTTPPRGASGLSEEVHALAGKAGRLFSLPENLVRAMVTVESGGRASAVSGKGAVGLMQLMPGTAKEMGVKDPRDAWDNLVGGAKYLAQQLERFGRLDQALAAYNAGPGAVEKHAGVPPFPETRNYVRRVLLAKARLDLINPIDG